MGHTEKGAAVIGSPLPQGGQCALATHVPHSGGRIPPLPLGVLAAAKPPSWNRDLPSFEGTCLTKVTRPPQGQPESSN